MAGEKESFTQQQSCFAETPCCTIAVLYLASLLLASKGCDLDARVKGCQANNLSSSVPRGAKDCYPGDLTLGAWLAGGCGGCGLGSVEIQQACKF
jgi:hypothetical protein